VENVSRKNLIVIYPRRLLIWRLESNSSL